VTFVKHDAGKLRFDLIDHRFERELAEVLTHGARKYADDNWKYAEPLEARRRYRAAYRRHENLWLDGEEFDTESGLPHLICMACCLMFLRWFERTKWDDGEPDLIDELEGYKPHMPSVGLRPENVE
jgi:hypothetical protein